MWCPDNAQQLKCWKQVHCAVWDIATGPAFATQSWSTMITHYWTWKILYTRILSTEVFTIPYSSQNKCRLFSQTVQNLVTYNFWQWFYMSSITSSQKVFPHYDQCSKTKHSGTEASCFPASVLRWKLHRAKLIWIFVKCWFIPPDESRTHICRLINWQHSEQACKGERV